jgi:hypothetical protein
MSDANVTRLGQINLTGDAFALFLKQFSGEILTAFERVNVMGSRHKVRTIPNGKSASFPVTGTIGAHYHTVGTEITGQKVEHGEKIITIDDKLLISDVFIANLDEAMLHFDVRGIYSTQMGRKLSNVYDKNVIIEFIKAARATATLTGGNGGTQISDDKFKINASSGSADVKAKAAALASGLFQAAQTLDEKDIPEEGRFALFRPAEYYALVQNTDVINRDWGGAGIYSDGKVWRVAGIEIVKSNNLVKTDTTSTSDDDYNAYHSVDASKTVGIVAVPDAVGTVKLLDLATEADYDIRRQGYLMVAKYAVGHGVLRPECSVELKLNTLSN